MTPSIPRRPSPLGQPAQGTKTALDRVTASPVPAGWRTRRKPTFNSAV